MWWQCFAGIFFVCLDHTTGSLTLAVRQRQRTHGGLKCWRAASIIQPFLIIAGFFFYLSCDLVSFEVCSLCSDLILVVILQRIKIFYAVFGTCKLINLTTSLASSSIVTTFDKIFYCGYSVFYCDIRSM